MKAATSAASHITPPARPRMESKATRPIRSAPRITAMISGTQNRTITARMTAGQARVAAVTCGMNDPPPAWAWSWAQPGPVPRRRRVAVAPRGGTAGASDGAADHSGGDTIVDVSGPGGGIYTGGRGRARAGGSRHGGHDPGSCPQAVHDVADQPFRRVRSGPQCHVDDLRVERAAAGGGGLLVEPGDNAQDAASDGRVRVRREGTSSGLPAAAGSGGCEVPAGVGVLWRRPRGRTARGRP